MEPEHLFKIVLIGSSGTGKSSIMTRYTKDKFNETTRATIAVDFSHKDIDIEGSTVKVEIWDTAGQERFRSVARSYYKNAAGVALVFSLNDMSTYENCSTWLDEIGENCEGAFILLIGNKSDLEEERVVPKVEAMEYAESHGILYIETSAMDNTNVAEAFDLLVAEIMRGAKKKNTEDTQTSEKPSFQDKDTVVITGNTGDGKDNPCEC